MRIRSAVGAVILAGDEVLLVHKVKASDALTGPMDLRGEWGFPMGGVLPDEDIHAALKREILEETGIVDFSIMQELPVYECSFSPEFVEKLGFDKQSTRMFLLRFEGNSNSLEPRCDEIESVQFFSRDRLAQMIHHPDWYRYFVESCP